MTDAEILRIRDEHLPSQGEPFDCIAFARAVLDYALTPAPAVYAPSPEHDKRGEGDADVAAAFDYVDGPGMLTRLPGGIGLQTHQGWLWHGWAIREAFLAGVTHAQAWRPMESIPRDDGKPVLVNTISGVPLLVTSDDACWYDWHTNRQLDETHFTGWSPIPGSSK